MGIKMPYDIITDENGKLVLLERNKVKGLVEGKERFVALRHDKHYEVYDEEYLAQAYLARYGGKIYKLTYYKHNDETLPISEFREVVDVPSA